MEKEQIQSRRRVRRPGAPLGRTAWRFIMTHVASPPFDTRPMLHALVRNWWLLLLRGIAAIVFGVLTFFWPGITLLTLLFLYVAFALVDGILAFAADIGGWVQSQSSGRRVFG